MLEPIPLMAGNSIREMQLADPVLGPLLQGKEAGEKPSPAKLGNPSSSSRCLLQLWEQLVTNKGILCRQFESLDDSSSTLQVVPEELEKEVLAELHQGVGGGHLGTDKTLAQLKERFYWPGHFNDVRDWCSNCG